MHWLYVTTAVYQKNSSLCYEIVTVSIYTLTSGPFSPEPAVLMTQPLAEYISHCVLLHQHIVPAPG